jgi:hypothetical protein
VIPLFRAYFDEFITSDVAKTNLKSECYIPTGTDVFIQNGSLRVHVLDPVKEGLPVPQWFGVTYKEDKEPTMKRVAELTQQGIYPAALWK